MPKILMLTLLIDIIGERIKSLFWIKTSRYHATCLIGTFGLDFGVGTLMIEWYLRLL